MRKYFLPFLMVTWLFSCQGKKKTNLNQTKVKPIGANDTIIGSKNITDELAGSAYRSRAKSYFVIIKNNTSDFRCVFEESKEGGKIGLILNLPYSKRAITYRQVKQELKHVLPAASKEFDFDSLNFISFGRLILSGDLAIAISKEYQQKFGLKSLENKPDYNQLSDFLQKSKLVRDVNSILEPYSISVKKVSFEKVFFTNKGELYWASKIETDSAEVPDKILDCMTWVTLKKTE